MRGFKSENIDDYIESFPEDIQQILRELRKTVQSAIPEATEAIKYDIPTYMLKGNLLHFAAYKKHIGFYPVPRSNQKLLFEINPYIKGKGTLQFPLNQPIPYKLIRRIVNELVIENLARAEEKIKNKRLN